MSPSDPSGSFGTNRNLSNGRTSCSDNEQNVDLQDLPKPTIVRTADLHYDSRIRKKESEHRTCLGEMRLGDVVCHRRTNACVVPSHSQNVVHVLGIVVLCLLCETKQRKEKFWILGLANQRLVCWTTFDYLCEFLYRRQGKKCFDWSPSKHSAMLRLPSSPLTSPPTRPPLVWWDSQSIPMEERT